MKKFRLKQGYGKHYIGLRCYEEGDIIDAFGIEEFGGAQDKFEEVVLPKRVRASKPAPISKPEPEPESEDELESESEPMLKMTHHGGGRYNVVNSVTDEIINDGWLTKEEAEALVNG